MLFIASAFMKSAYFGYQGELEERRKSPWDGLLSLGALTALLHYHSDLPPSSCAAPCSSCWSLCKMQNHLQQKNKVCITSEPTCLALTLCVWENLHDFFFFFKSSHLDFTTVALKLFPKHARYRFNNHWEWWLVWGPTLYFQKPP